MPLHLNKVTFVNYKKEDMFNKVYDSDGEPWPFSDMEYLEDTQDFDECNLPDVSPTDAGKTFSPNMKVMNLSQK